MKKNWLPLLFTVLIGCAGSPTRTAVDAERNRMDMIDIKTNMSMDEVQDRMGVPKKIERRSMEGIEYEIWYYLTRGVNLAQTRFIDENFTPFVFYSNYLKGWGWQFYNHLFDINNARFKDEEYKRKGSNSGEGWSDYENKIINPYKKKGKEPEEKSVEETLRKFIESGKETPVAPKPNSQTAPVPENTKTAPQTSTGGSLEVIEKRVKDQTVPTIIKETESVPSAKGQSAP